RTRAASRPVPRPAWRPPRACCGQDAEGADRLGEERGEGGGGADPVTGLLTAAELLPPGRPTELVRDRAQAMRTLVEDVLEVSRLGRARRR
ncbi:hypothetical protein CLM82_19060, partial [Streptomyces albidoflavus]